MRKVQNLGDNRFKGYCVHCGGPNQTVDHNPSKVFLDKPLPADLPTNPACFSCNNRFSSDEAYLACLVECAETGKIEPNDMERHKIAELLRKRKHLLEKMRVARRETAKGLAWRADIPKVKRVACKLARGHVAYEMEPQLEAPLAISILPLCNMSKEYRQWFEQEGWNAHGLWPECGTRAMRRLVEETDPFAWLVVQEGRYRYRVTCDNHIVVRLVIREYLAAVVVWE